MKYRCKLAGNILTVRNRRQTFLGTHVLRVARTPCKRSVVDSISTVSTNFQYLGPQECKKMQLLDESCIYFSKFRSRKILINTKSNKIFGMQHNWSCARLLTEIIQVRSLSCQPNSLSFLSQKTKMRIQVNWQTTSLPWKTLWIRLPLFAPN